MKSEKMQRIAAEYQTYIEEHFQESEASGAAIKEYLDNSTAAYNGLVVHTLHIPKIFTEKEIGFFRKVVDTTYGILEGNTGISEKSGVPEDLSLFQRAGGTDPGSQSV